MAITEGTLIQRGKRGIWYWKHQRDGRTVWKNLHTTSRAEARLLRAAEITEYHRNGPPKPWETRNPTIEEFWTRYLPHMQGEGKRRTTIRNHENFLKLVVKYAGAERMGDITTEVMQRFKHDRKAQGYADESFNNIRRDIRTMYRIAIEKGWFTGDNPTAGVEPYKLEGRLVTYHTEPELLRLLEAAQDVGRDTEWIVLLGGWAGLRRNEIVNMVWEHLDFTAGQPTIRIAPVGEFRPKNRQERVIPMNRRIYEALYPHRRPSGYLFDDSRSRGGATTMYRFDGTKGLRTALRAAGLDTRDPFQRLRRSFGTILARRGVSVFLVAQWCGHTVAVAEKHYWGQGGYDSAIDSF